MCPGVLPHWFPHQCPSSSAGSCLQLLMKAFFPQKLVQNYLFFRPAHIAFCPVTLFSVTLDLAHSFIQSLLVHSFSAAERVHGWVQVSKTPSSKCQRDSSSLCVFDQLFISYVAMGKSSQRFSSHIYYAYFYCLITLSILLVPKLTLVFNNTKYSIHAMYI